MSRFQIAILALISVLVLAGVYEMTSKSSVLIEGVSVHSHPNQVVARVEGQKLTLEGLRRSLGPALVPVEKDEYQILLAGVRSWIDQSILQNEAQRQGILLNELYGKHVWKRVEVTDSAVVAFYRKNRNLYSKPLNTLREQVTSDFRKQEFEKAKKEYVEELRGEYYAAVYLQDPESGRRPEERVVEGAGAAGAAPRERPRRRYDAASIKEAPSRGDPNAPITLEEFADFHCSFCRRAVKVTGQLMENYSGQIRWVFRHFPLRTSPGQGSFLTHEASVCAQEQGKFWEFHSFAMSSNRPPTRAQIFSFPANHGLNVAQFQECVDSHKYQDFIIEESEEGRRRGVRGTPAFFMNDYKVTGARPYEHFSDMIEGILDPAKKDLLEKRIERRREPKEKVTFDDLEGKPALGPKDAPVILVEFGDYHCPFCKRALPTVNQIMENYKGKIRRVWRHFPLSFHKGAERTHQAAACAHEQGKFWDYHAGLFSVRPGAGGDAAYIKLAQEAGLNKKKFKTCLESGKYQELIKQEVAKGVSYGVSGTPSFFINGNQISGAQPYEAFDRLIKKELSQAS